ncbi:uncharacterized protein LOC117305823 isoform X2 [Asterias rubens]|uniref:uncharacterized protein LOC117305823 isoform X2 n=1 Tax=Asterias rubens TaxID=7604 RepID=UPI0014558788|nr:uncharacterized protein LOC117305823 isoform X2 [Asterias rubens]
MGNLSSQEDDSYTDDSLMSERSARMRPSRGHNIPIEPPAADLSHLTEQERAHILSVLQRARDLQTRDERRVRDLEDDFSNYAASVLQRSSDATTTAEVDAAAGAAPVKQRDLCPICHQTELIPDPQPGTAQEGLSCGDCERIVCLQCGFYTPAITSDTETWLCNMCQRRRRFIATSGLWHVGRRSNGRFSGSKLQRRSSLDETESALKRSAKKAHKLERMASYSQYEEMKTDHDRTREGAISSPSPEGACAASVGPSSAISNQPRRTPTGGREKFNARTETAPPSKPPRSASRDDPTSSYSRTDTHQYPDGGQTAAVLSQALVHQDSNSTDAMTMSSASSAERMQETTTEESEIDFDEDEMMRQLLEMAGDKNTNVSTEPVDTEGEQIPGQLSPDYGDVEEETKDNTEQDLSNNNTVEDYATQHDGKQSYLQRRFGDLDVLYEEDTTTREPGTSHESQEGVQSFSAKTMLTERERELVQETGRNSRSKILSFSQRSSSADCTGDDEVKANGAKGITSSSSFDSYEYHSDSEIKSSRSRLGRDMKDMSTLSGSDPRLVSDSESPNGDSINASKGTLEKLFVPQSSPDDFATDEKYRSVEDLTKIGKEDSVASGDTDNGTTRVGTPAVGQPQFQYSKQKPNSLPRRRRSRPVMELPLSPIFDEEAGSPDDDLEHPAGDFSSPEYADPSLAEDSPFEYEYDDDADASQEGLSSDDDKELPRTKDDLQAMEGEETEQQEFVEDFAIRSREDGLETLVEEQEEVPEQDTVRERQQPASTNIVQTHESITRSLSSEKHKTEQLLREAVDNDRGAASVEHTGNIDDADSETRSATKEQFKHLQRHSQDDINSSSSLTSSQSSDEPPDTVRSNQDTKDAHGPRPKPPPLGNLPARYSMEAYSSLESEEGNSLLSSPRTPSYDTDSFERPKVASPGRKAAELDSPLSPGFRFSPPATPKHLLEASKHMNDDSYSYDNSPSELSDEIQMSPVTLTVCKSVITHMGTSFDDYSGPFPTSQTVANAVGPDLPSFVDLPSAKPIPQTVEEPEASKKKANTADACTGTQTEHILSVMIPKSSPFRRSEEEKPKSVKMQSTSSQTTTPVSDTDTSAGSSPIKQTPKAKILKDAGTDATLDSPSFSPMSPMHVSTHHAKTTSIAVGTSPEYSPPSSAPSTDTESVASRSSRLKYVHGGFGSDGDTTDWGASMPFSSIASSSGASSPERSSSLRSTPLKYLPLESSSASNTSPPAARRSRADRETSTQRGSTAPARTRMMRESVSSERRTSSSDIDSCDSDGGTPSSTPRKVRRRLPSIPADQVPVTAPRSSGSHKVFLEKDQNISDPSKQLELQRVKEMLSRKAAAIEKQRREEELRNLRIEADRQRVGAAAERIARRRQPKPRGRFYSDGSVSDSEVGPIGSGRESREKDILDTDWRLGAPALSMQTLNTIDSQQSPTHARYGLEPPGAPRSTLFLSKSEEDIIREIEKQISETTGKAYQAYDRTEIERDVRRRYGALHDSDRSCSSQYSSSSGSRGSLSDSWSSVTFELPDYRLRTVRQKLKEELKLVTADKKAQLDRDAVTNEPARTHSSHGKEFGGRDSSAMGLLYAHKNSGKLQLLTVPSTDKPDKKGNKPNAGNRLSPQASPQRRRNRRQAADSVPPMFSPIKEDVDIEAEVIQSQGKLLHHSVVEHDAILMPEGEQGNELRRYRYRNDVTPEERSSPLDTSTSQTSSESTSSGHRRRRRDTPGNMRPEEADRLSREGEIIEKQIREQQDKEFRREIERRKKQMEDSAKRLDELKIRRGIEWSAVGGAPSSKGGQGPVKLSQSLDEIARRGDSDHSPLRDHRRYGSLETVTRDRTRGTREVVSMSTPQLTDRERAVIKRDQQGLILPLDEETRLQKGSSEQGKRPTRSGRDSHHKLERSSSREKRPHRQDSMESVGSHRGHSEDDEAGYSDSSKGSSRRRRSTEERRSSEESSRHHRDRDPPRDHHRHHQRDRDHGRSSPASHGRSSPASHGRTSPASHYQESSYRDYQRRPHHRSREDVVTTPIEERGSRDRDLHRESSHHRQHSRSREDISSSERERERARTISPSPVRDQDRDSHRERELHRDHRRRQHHHSGEDLSKGAKNNSERPSAGSRSRSLPRVLQSERRQASPEDYYYGDQVYRMQASEWTRRADDSGDDEDERRRQAICQSVPAGSRHMQPRQVSRADYQFPTRRFRLPRDPNDKKCRNHGIGMRIIGGKRIPGSDQLVAYIAEIHRAGVADREGLREGDQVLEWCGMPLTGRTYEEVQRITRTPNGDVEVVVKCGTNLLESPRQRTRPPGDNSPRSRATSNPPQLIEEETLEEEAIRNGVDPRMLSERLEGISKAQYVYSSPTTSANTENSSPKRKGRDRNKKISGEIQIQLDYDGRTGDLIVGILRGRSLAPKDINGLADPFVKTCLLPGRGPDNKRKTRYVPKTLTPEWNQTVLYRAVRPQELATKILEISVWDFDRFTFNDFMGQILIDLSDSQILDNRPRWFSLQDQPASTGQQEAFSPRALSPVTTVPGNHQGHPLSILTRGRGASVSGDHGSPERRRALSRSMERVQVGSAAQQLMESDSQSSRSSGYEYDTDRSTQSDKSGWSQEHPHDKSSKTQPPSSNKTKGTHQNGHRNRVNGGEKSTDRTKPSTSTHATKESSPPKGQPPKSSPTSTTKKPSSISTSVKVTVTTKHPTGKQGPKETKSNTQERRTPEATKKQQPKPKNPPEKKVRSRTLSPERTTDKVKLSPSNVRASKPRNEPSIFHYTSTNPSRRTASEQADGKGSVTSKSAQNLSIYHDKPSTSSETRRSSAEGPALRVNGPESIHEEDRLEESPSSDQGKHVAVSPTREPVKTDQEQTGKADVVEVEEGSVQQQRQEIPEESALLNGGHGNERLVGGVPSLWVRKPQLGTGPNLEDDTLMQMNLKAAMYTRMFAGDLGPGQIIDPEMPRDYETTGEIRIGLKKETKADGDKLYVEIIQCRKISYKFKTENPPDLYVKGYLVVGDRKVSKKKTHICKFSKEPNFNEVFMYSTSVTGLALQVSLWADGGRFGRNTLLGEAMIWLDNVPFIPNSESEAWYKLLLASHKCSSSP